MEWKWCYNRLTEPFYDRSWQVEVVGPIDASVGSGDWANLIVSTSGVKHKMQVDKSA